MLVGTPSQSAIDGLQTTEFGHLCYDPSQRGVGVAVGGTIAEVIVTLGVAVGLTPAIVGVGVVGVVEEQLAPPQLQLPSFTLNEQLIDDCTFGHAAELPTVPT